MTHFDIVPVDPADPALVDSWLAAQESVHAHDFEGLRPEHPLRDLTALVLRDADTRRERWAAVCDGEVLGHLRLDLPIRDNTHLAGFQVGVRPGSRRHGIGSALLRHAEERAVEAGRTSLSTWLALPDDAAPGVRGDGGPFLIAKGYQRSLEGMARRCDLDAVDETDLEARWQAALEKAGDFEVIAFQGVPPEDLLEGLAYLHARMYTDMPLGDWDLQEASITGDHVREWECLRARRGVLNLQVVVRHKESGELAGFTEIHIGPGEEEHCLQGATIVDPRYRGHRLGLVLKIANQRRIREWRPRMQYVWTGNADSNTQMIAINEAVGYRLAGRETLFQKKLA